eukprot:CAMPEP_0179844538 /NCGR_PEP_ID=MMETSP0982-20121206/4399_1 /TAXON_ID=483367 /ORGANISM="non described non described, Strain CCMP 2436" /LENGTH=471 /DNA_ID=CAMNT_0021729255 /DNA_START=752 /DNA_END=2165 /DNA_ORIENTATION=+
MWHHFDTNAACAASPLALHDRGAPVLVGAREVDVAAHPVRTGRRRDRPVRALEPAAAARLSAQLLVGLRLPAVPILLGVRRGCPQPTARRVALVDSPHLGLDREPFEKVRGLEAPARLLRDRELGLAGGPDHARARAAKLPLRRGAGGVDPAPERAEQPLVRELGRVVRDEDGGELRIHHHRADPKVSHAVCKLKLQRSASGGGAAPIPVRIIAGLSGERTALIHNVRPDEVSDASASLGGSDIRLPGPLLDPRATWVLSVGLVQVPYSLIQVPYSLVQLRDLPQPLDNADGERQADTLAALPLGRREQQRVAAAAVPLERLASRSGEATRRAQKLVNERTVRSVAPPQALLEPPLPVVRSRVPHENVLPRWVGGAIEPDFRLLLGEQRRDPREAERDSERERRAQELGHHVTARGPGDEHREDRGDARAHARRRIHRLGERREGRGEQRVAPVALRERGVHGEPVARGQA